MTSVGEAVPTSDADRRAAELDLQHAAEGVRDVLGYGVVAISLLRDTGEFEYVAVVGPPDARDYLLGTHLAAEFMRVSIAAAEVTGRVHYVPRGTTYDAGPRWEPDIPATDDPEVWHPDDELFVLLTDATGAVRGHVAVDGPPDGRVPGPAQRRQLEAYVDRMVPTVLHADAHRRIADQLRIAAQARVVVRRAITRLDESDLFAACAPDLAECLRADQVWFHTDGTDGFLTHSSGHDAGSAADLAPFSDRLWRMARETWRRQQAVVVELERVLPEGPGSDGSAEVLAQLQAMGLESLLMAPVGAGADCLGMVVGVRRSGAVEWTDLEVVAAQDLGRDLGSALQAARFFDRERGHAAYKQQLIGTIAHELKNPLTAVRGNLELLADELTADQHAAQLLTDRIERATMRLSALVGNLLTLSEVDDTAGDGGRRRLVALTALVADAVEVVTDQAAAREIDLAVESSADVEVDGIPGELEHLVVNLVSNAVKYSDPGGPVRVQVGEEGGCAVLRVTDRGIGIAPDEVPQIFGEFFRSADPAARQRPGTGLGLAIASRVVERHDGTIEVDSSPGVGTVLTVRLPATRSAADGPP